MCSQPASQPASSHHTPPLPLRSANFLDPHIKIGLPIFTIHGNHDDPAGQVRCGCQRARCAATCRFRNAYASAQALPPSPALPQNYCAPSTLCNCRASWGNDAIPGTCDTWRKVPSFLASFMLCAPPARFLPCWEHFVSTYPDAPTAAAQR
jgi:hypothetical protein